MLVYSHLHKVREGETGVHLWGLEYNFLDPVPFAVFRAKDFPKYSSSEKQIYMRCDPENYPETVEKIINYAKEQGMQSLAMPCPCRSSVELSQLRERLSEYSEDMDIRLVFSKEQLRFLAPSRYSEVMTQVREDYEGRDIAYSKGVNLKELREQYKEKDYIQEHGSGIHFSLGEIKEEKEKKPKLTKEELYEELKRNAPALQKSFSDMLFEFIRKKELDEVQVYKNANLTKQHFSKIRSNSSYRPSKATALSLCIGMKLNIEETEALLNTLGLSLSRSDLSDVIVRAFILNEIYDIDEVNLCLLNYNQKPLTYFY